MDGLIWFGPVWLWVHAWWLVHWHDGFRGAGGRYSKALWGEYPSAAYLFWIWLSAALTPSVSRNPRVSAVRAVLGISRCTKCGARGGKLHTGSSIFFGGGSWEASEGNRQSVMKWWRVRNSYVAKTASLLLVIYGWNLFKGLSIPMVAGL